MQTTWQPKHDQLLVRPLTPADRTLGGMFIIPEEHRERPMMGVVIAAGPGMVATETGRTVPMSSAIGDLVAFGRFAGSDFDIDGQKVLVMRDLEAILRKPLGTYELVEHEDGRYRHEAGYLCEHCPASTALEDERKRLLEETDAREGVKLWSDAQQLYAGRCNAESPVEAEGELAIRCTRSAYHGGDHVGAMHGTSSALLRRWSAVDQGGVESVDHAIAVP